MDSNNEWLFLLASLQQNLNRFFVLTLEMLFRGNFERFKYFNFKSNFLENENLFQKTGVPFFS